MKAQFRFRDWFSLSLSLAFSLLLTSVGQAQDQDAEKEKLKAELKAYSHRIVFEAYDKNNWELFSIAADGSDLKNLTNTPDKHELYPQSSPDGSMIAFLCDEVRGADTVRSIDFMKSDGTERKRVTEKGREPCWAPDGKKIGFPKQEFDKFNITDYVSKGFYFYDVATGEITQAPNKAIHHIYNPNLSKDGNWLVTTVHGGMGFKHGIIAIDWKGDRVVDLEVTGCRPCLSSDGDKVTWSSDDHTIRVASISTEGPSPAITDAKIVHHEDKLHTYHPDLSPDGNYLVFSVGPGGRVLANGPGTHTQVAEMIGVRGQWHLYVRRADGTGPAVQLTFGDDSTSKEAEWIRVEK